MLKTGDTDESWSEGTFSIESLEFHFFTFENENDWML